MTGTPRARPTTGSVGKKTGPKPSFTREDVIEAVMGIGIADFTLSGVARRLGVVTPALYRVFPSRDAVLDACLARVAATIQVPAPTVGWQEALRLWASECWRMCEEVPGLARTLYAYPPSFSHIEEPLHGYVGAIEGHGKTRSQAAFALDFIGDTVMACRLGIESMREVDPSGESGLEKVRGRIGEAHLFQPDDTWSDRGFVDVKVNFIIDGLERNWPEV
ncbi:TetR/AcrR family transcriptional regulator [Corynebacterium sp. USCH3]|uniref:TetR/AcrR family transcriptional regulator n=1 Tax=Corynebacterium sp. USCH3 TaxID=3024840 RepID=UPI0030984197